MGFFLTAWRQALTTRLSGRRLWLLLLLPLAAFGVRRLLPPEETAAPVRVGVVLPEEGGEGFWALLQARNGLVVTFLESEEGQAERQVGLGRWDCALILPEDFQARLDRGETAGLFTLLTGPGSAVYPMVRETVAACAAQCLSPGMAEDYLLDSGILSQRELDGVRPRLRQVLGVGERVQVAMETLTGTPLAPISLAGSGVSRLVAGLTAILLLLWALLAAMDLGRWRDSPPARRLAPLVGETALLLPRLAAGLIPALGTGSLALLAAERPLGFILPLFPYLLFLGGVSLALSRVGRLWRALPVLLPLVPVAGLLLSPVLLDLSQLFPALTPLVRWSPVTLYLRACGGAWQDGLLLAVAGAAMFGLSLAADRKTN